MEKYAVYFSLSLSISFIRLTVKTKYTPLITKATLKEITADITPPINPKAPAKRVRQKHKIKAFLTPVSLRIFISVTCLIPKSTHCLYNFRILGVILYFSRRRFIYTVRVLSVTYSPERLQISSINFSRVKTTPIFENSTRRSLYSRAERKFLLPFYDVCLG